MSTAAVAGNPPPPKQPTQQQQQQPRGGGRSAAAMMFPDAVDQLDALVEQQHLSINDDDHEHEHHDEDFDAFKSQDLKSVVLDSKSNNEKDNSSSSSNINNNNKEVYNKNNDDRGEEKIILEEEQQQESSSLVDTTKKTDSSEKEINNKNSNNEKDGSSKPPSPPPTTPDQQQQQQQRRFVTSKDFELLKVIGMGAFGKVLQVRNRQNKQVLAMKVISKRLLRRKTSYVENVQAERNILTKIRHPYVVTMHCSFQTQEKLFIIMDFLAGGELFLRIGREGIFLEKTASFYLAEIILALDHLHTHGVLHRDLKPENILLGSDGHVCLTDFGLAKDFSSDADFQSDDDDGARALTVCGTMEYMAPEMVARKGYGRAADYWSLGCIAYEMMSGLPPFEMSKHGGSKELFRRIMTEKVKMPSGTSANACKLLKGLLTRDVQKRLGTSRSTMFEIGGVAFLKKIDFFSSINWEKLELKEVDPPHSLSVDHDQDLRHFHDEFTTMTIPRSVVEMSKESFQARRVNSTQFRGFSFIQEDFELPDRPQSVVDSYWDSQIEDAESDSDKASSKMDLDELLAEPVGTPVAEKKKRPPRKRKKKKAGTLSPMLSNTNTPAASGTNTPSNSAPNTPVPSVNDDTVQKLPNVSTQPSAVGVPQTTKGGASDLAEPTRRDSASALLNRNMSDKQIVKPKWQSPVKNRSLQQIATRTPPPLPPKPVDEWQSVGGSSSSKKKLHNKASKKPEPQRKQDTSSWVQGGSAKRSTQLQSKTINASSPRPRPEQPVRRHQPELRRDDSFSSDMSAPSSDWRQHAMNRSPRSARPVRSQFSPQQPWSSPGEHSLPQREARLPPMQAKQTLPPQQSWPSLGNDKSLPGQNAPIPHNKQHPKIQGAWASRAKKR